DAGRSEVVGEVGERPEAGQLGQGVLVQHVYVRRVAGGVHRLELVVVVAPVGGQRLDVDAVVSCVVGVDDRLDDAGLADGGRYVGPGLLAGAEEARQGQFGLGEAGAGHGQGGRQGDESNELHVVSLLETSGGTDG